jgi:uncharacterized protein (DUF427 family)
MKAIWNDNVIAESDSTIVVEGNHYFPPDSVNTALIAESAKQTVCSWKGTASYYDIVVGDQRNADAAWYYADPKDAASNITGYVAFWKGVTVSA